MYPTNLLADNQPESGGREMCASRWKQGNGRFSSPWAGVVLPQLDDGIHYEIHAWYPKIGQETLISFPFDLSGPPGLTDDIAPAQEDYISSQWKVYGSRRRRSVPSGKTGKPSPPSKSISSVKFLRAAE